ncbi:MAG TPA: hypothetical protein VGL23_08905 [Chloroflexota bacterium]
MLLVLAGCSPEASRARGAGPGADVGNHGSPIRLHEGNDPAFKEPIVGQAVRR